MRDFDDFVIYTGKASELRLRQLVRPLMGLLQIQIRQILTINYSGENIKHAKTFLKIHLATGKRIRVGCDFFSPCKTSVL